MSANLAPPPEMDGIGIDHRFHRGYFQHPNLAPFTAQPSPLRKRRAEAPPENNERLSKRMSLLNLEQSGQKLYVPVENTNIQSSDLAGDAPYPLRHRPKSKFKSAIPADDSLMHLDDTKHKVYIYNLDDELSSDNESDTNADYDRNGNNLIFLPDIEKHLRATRIPHYVLEPGRLPDPAADKQLVLYSESVPSSLSVPAEQDSVRKAIIETRARARERQRAGRERETVREGPVPVPVPVPVVAQLGYVPMDAEENGFAGGTRGIAPEEDPDAMELD